MENKSNELAKLLNIKPKYRGSRWEFKDRTHFVNSKIFNTKEEAREYNNEEEFNVEELNVDFKNPVNFVKLLNLLLLNNFSLEFDPNKRAEIQLVDIIINMYNNSNNPVIKQRAQQIDWEYK